MSTADDRSAAQKSALQAVELQRNFLRNPLPAGPGICAVCRGGVDPSYAVCYQCKQHRNVAGGRLADVVVPIAYAIKGGQHAHNLAVYKSPSPSALAQFNLSALGMMFLGRHWGCLVAAAGGPLTHVATVPSTRGRPGPHPLELILASRVGLPPLHSIANSGYSSDDRRLYHDRFRLPPGAATGARVLLLDDTWTSGGRLQSLAFTLREAGAVSVVAVVLGRHVNPTFGPSGPMVERLRTGPWFDLGTCSLATH